MSYNIPARERSMQHRLHRYMYVLVCFATFVALAAGSTVRSSSIGLDTQGNLQISTDAEHHVFVSGTNMTSLVANVAAHGAMLLAHSSSLASQASTITAITKEGTAMAEQLAAQNATLAALVSSIIGLNASIAMTATTAKTATVAAITTPRPATLRVISNGSTTHSFLSISLTNSGCPAVAFRDIGLYLIVCTDALCATPPTLRTVDDSSKNVGWYTNLIMHSSGRALLAYFDFTTSSLKYAYSTDASCTNFTIKTLDAGGIAGLELSMKLNQNGSVLVSYSTIPASLRLAICADFTCNSTVLRNVSLDNAHFTSLQINSLGRPTIAFENQTTFVLQLAICADATCQQRTIKTIDADKEVGKYAALQFTSTGVPVIAYQARTLSAIKIAICSDANCTNSTIRVFDQTGVSAQDISLALINDVPIISYFDEQANDLRAVYCNDATCSTTRSVKVDSIGDIGRFASMQMASTGPIVAYVDGYPNNDIKLAIL